MRRSPDQMNDPFVVGNLTLKGQKYLCRVLRGEDGNQRVDVDSGGDSVDSYLEFCPGVSVRDAASDLEMLQVILHLAVQEDEQAVVSVATKDSMWRKSRVPFHNEIRAHWDQFVEELRNNPVFDHFDITNISLPPAPFFADNILPILQNRSLMRLDLKNCNLTSSEFRGIAQILKNVPTLTSLSLSRSKFRSADDAKLVSTAIAKHKGLSFVDLSRCGLGENEDEDIFPSLLNGCKKLNVLDLSQNNFGPESLARIAKFLGTHKSITILNLGENEFDDDSVTSLNNAVEKNKTLVELSLLHTGIALTTTTQRSLVLNNKLMHIDLSCNDLGANGAKSIIKHLKNNPPLSVLSLARCGLPTKSAKGLCNALKRNTSLAHLNLQNNSFNNKAIPFFVDALRNNTTLLTLDMRSNDIKVQSGRKELIKGALCDPTSLQTIAESNHKCQLWLNCGKIGNKVANEIEFRNINSLDNEGQKIRFKVIAALFTLETIAFNPRDFQNIPLELMPRLLELVQQELGYGRYGREVWKAPIRAKGSNPCLTRVYEVVHGWTMLPSLFAVSIYYSMILVKR